MPRWMSVIRIDEWSEGCAVRVTHLHLVETYQTQVAVRPCLVKEEVVRGPLKVIIGYSIPPCGPEIDCAVGYG